MDERTNGPRICKTKLTRSVNSDSENRSWKDFTVRLQLKRNKASFFKSEALFLKIKPHMQKIKVHYLTLLVIMHTAMTILFI